VIYLGWRHYVLAGVVLLDPEPARLAFHQPAANRLYPEPITSLW